MFQNSMDVKLIHKRVAVAKKTVTSMQTFSVSYTAQKNKVQNQVKL